MLKVKNIIIRNSSIMLIDTESLGVLRNAIADIFGVGISGVSFIHEELNGTLDENDPCLKSLLKLKDEVADN